MPARKNKGVFLIGGALLSIALLAGCISSPPHERSRDTKLEKPASADPADLQAAMDKLQESIQKPASPFHASFKKSTSDGFSYSSEADVSPNGITGKQTDVSPQTNVGGDVFPASTRVRDLNGSPAGGPAFQAVAAGMIMAYLNGHIQDAQEGVKYIANEQTGGYDARRYDFDLTGVDATIKRAMQIGNAAGLRQTKDYNVKGSAWIAKDDGRMVKFSFDNIYTFSDGKVESTHYEGAVTK